jgi:hypothetical protein
MIERPEKILRFLADRIKLMGSADLAMGCFLKWDDASHQAIANEYCYTMNPYQLSGVVEYYCRLPLAKELLLRNEGVSDDDLLKYVSAFSHDAVSGLFNYSFTDAELLQLTPMSTATDDNVSISALGCIWQAKAKVRSHNHRQREGIMKTITRSYWTWALANSFPAVGGGYRPFQQRWLSIAPKRQPSSTDTTGNFKPLVKRARKLTSPLTSPEEGEPGYEESMERFRAGIEGIKRNNALAKWKAGSSLENEKSTRVKKRN